MMDISFDAQVRVPDNVLFRQLEDESVLLHLNKEIYYGLDDVGTRMWQVLAQSETIQTAFDALSEEYDIEPEVLQRDLTGLIENLLAKDLLEIHTP